MNKDARLVYSSDPEQNKKCPKCKEIVAACVCEPEVKNTAKYVPVMRIEKQGRGGKTVTVVDRLPKQELFLKQLCTDLKKKCGSGGTYNTEGQEGIVEIQGDKREIIRKYFADKGIQTKG
jgi:translation initiation factor 1